MEITVFELFILILLANIITDLFAVIVNTSISKYENYKKKKKYVEPKDKECNSNNC